MDLAGVTNVEGLVEKLRSAGYVITHGAEVNVEGGDKGKGKRVILDEKYFRRLEKFEKDESKWGDWVFNLFVVVSGVDKECAGAMEVMLKETLTVVNEMEVDLKVGTDLREKFGGELFGVLCSVTSGEANMIVRSVVGKGVGYCGFTALYLFTGLRLCRRPLQNSMT